MKTNIITAKSILKKLKKIDSWLLCNYTMNLYRGCVHDCKYCDGRSEYYQVNTSFHDDIGVKINAIDILEKELKSIIKSKVYKRGFVIPGSGIADCYQLIEKKYKLTRKSLELFEQYSFPVSIITKSSLILRDIDLISRINKQTKALVTFSFSTVDDKIAQIFEPYATPPSERLQTIAFLKQNGIATGACLLPVLPFISDSYAQLEESINKLKEAGADYITFGGLTLKPGRQREYYYSVIKRYYPHLIPKYRAVYNNKYGNPNIYYETKVNKLFYTLAEKHKVSIKIPFRIFNDSLDINKKVVVIFDHIHDMLNQMGVKNNFNNISIEISKIKESLSDIYKYLYQFDNIDDNSISIIKEIVETGRSSLYDKVMNFDPVQ